MSSFSRWQTQLVWLSRQVDGHNWQFSTTIQLHCATWILFIRKQFKVEREQNLHLYCNVNMCLYECLFVFVTFQVLIKINYQLRLTQTSIELILFIVEEWSMFTLLQFEFIFISHCYCNARLYSANQAHTYSFWNSFPRDKYNRK